MKNELAFKDHDRGLQVAMALLDEDYVVMLSYEEDLLIINYEWSEHYADRNDMVFMRRDEYDEESDALIEDVKNDIANDIKSGYSIESILGNRLL